MAYDLETPPQFQKATLYASVTDKSKGNFTAVVTNLQGTIKPINQPRITFYAQILGPLVTTGYKS